MAETLYPPLSNEQMTILVVELRSDIKEIKESIISTNNSLLPLKEWQAKVTGGLIIISSVLILIGASLGYGFTQWDNIRLDNIRLKDKQEEQIANNAAILNQLSIIRADQQTNANAIGNLPQEVADLKSKLSADETSGILKGRGKETN